jgi:cytochrome P450 family 4
VHRRLISPAFNTKLLEEYMKVFNEKNKILVQKLEDEIGKGEFDVIEYIEPMNLDTICSEDVYFILYEQVALIYIFQLI